MNVICSSFFQDIYATFTPEHAFELARKLEIHYTPKYGSWLNIAEIELSLLGRQCLSNDRIPDSETLRALVVPWCTDRKKTKRC